MDFGILMLLLCKIPCDRLTHRFFLVSVRHINRRWKESQSISEMSFSDYENHRDISDISDFFWSPRWRSKVVSTHRTGTHPEQPLPTGYNGVPFIVGKRGIAEGVCDIGVWHVIFLDSEDLPIHDYHWTPREAVMIRPVSPHNKSVSCLRFFSDWWGHCLDSPKSVAQFWAAANFEESCFSFPIKTRFWFD